MFGIIFILLLTSHFVNKAVCIDMVPFMSESSFRYASQEPNRNVFKHFTYYRIIIGKYRSTSQSFVLLDSVCPVLRLVQLGKIIKKPVFLYIYIFPTPYCSSAYSWGFYTQRYQLSYFLQMKTD